MKTFKLLVLVALIALALYEVPLVPFKMTVLIVGIALIEYWHTKTVQERAQYH